MYTFKCHKNRVLKVTQVPGFRCMEKSFLTKSIICLKSLSESSVQHLTILLTKGSRSTPILNSKLKTMYSKYMEF